MTRHDDCVICGLSFITGYPHKKTCSPECSRENQRRGSLRWYYAREERRRAEIEARQNALREARKLDPVYAAEWERHQAHLRRIWSEHGLDLGELVRSSIYLDGFTAPQAAAVVNA